MNTRLLPAEWQPQTGVMLTWPHPHSDWAPLLPAVDPVYCDIVAQISAREKALVICYDEAHQKHVQKLLKATTAVTENVYTLAEPTNDTWIRDYGPITVLDNSTPILWDYGFNGWGDKYPHELDNSINRKLKDRGIFNATQMRHTSLILEGGSIDSNGEGLLLSTTQCLLSNKRNPQLTQVQIEQRLREDLGIKQILWLNHGHLMGDDTDSHIDTLARFTDSHTIVYCACDDRSDPHYADLLKMKIELERIAEQFSLILVPLPLPPAIVADQRRLPATYANFLIINGAVLVPLYGEASDDLALEALRECFPRLEVIGINCRPLIYQNGSLHCATMQLPTGALDNIEQIKSINFT